ncbi:MAG: signal peptidase I [Eubacteriaceae bacterium]|nr:signal peptidase I [Eubacteriaceae bacterium]
MTKEELGKEIREWIKALFTAVIFGLVLHFFIFETVYVQQRSMYPTLKEGERLIMLKINYIVGRPKRGDIAIVKIDPTSKYVKRVIGLPGETIQIAGNVVYINGDVLDEPYLDSRMQYSDYPLTTIPEGMYFVMGDNRPDSLDSRSPMIGFIFEEEFLGKVSLRFSPFGFF